MFRCLPNVQSQTVLKVAAFDPPIFIGTVPLPSNEILIAYTATTLVDNPLDLVFFNAVLREYRWWSRGFSFGEERRIIVNVRLEFGGVKDIVREGSIWEFNTIRGDVWVSFDNLELAVPSRHELGHSFVASLRVLATVVEGV